MSTTATAKSISRSRIKEILSDYKLCFLSREASIIGRKEVFMGKAKFGIFGDGKEVAQAAMAKVFREGDFRSGYYRDQTFAFAIGQATVQQYFAQLYAHANVENEPFSGGRQMVNHFASRLLDEEGEWKDLTRQKNIFADVSPTGGQMPRLVGLGYASKLFRENTDLKKYKHLSKGGNEIAFGTIGNASTAEGVFFESMNAIGVLQIPVIMSIWDDDYGISVHQKFQTVKEKISEALAGFQRDNKNPGFEIFVVKGWDYEDLCKVYEKAEKLAREKHVPVMVHVTEMTQPQGHSTSGSHERYKSKERLEWEKDHDCIRRMRNWILDNEFATEEELDQVEDEARKEAKSAKNAAWKSFMDEIREEQDQACQLMSEMAQESKYGEEIAHIVEDLGKTLNPIHSDTIKAVRRSLWLVNDEQCTSKDKLRSWLDKQNEINHDRYSSSLYNETKHSALNVGREEPQFKDDSKFVDGREVLQACFDAALARDPRVFAFGEDLGKIGDVNQGFAGLQEKYGELRVTDTGIRESTIIGQGIGAAVRGLRPIAEIQYLDYIFYTMHTLTDDLATLHYRSKGGQVAPLIVRTRGHRLEGIWHSGSLIGTLLHSLRGIYILVPRNMCKAAAFYNTMLKSDDPALIIECLNGYRLKERFPENIGEITEPLGVPEVIREGNDVTIVTYGSMCRIVNDAAADLSEAGISCEVIDAQTLLPFDINHSIVESIKKTNRVIFADEDVPGGASAYMMQKVLEEQDAYKFLDSQPVTITARPHRPAYATDGDYFSKPNPEDIYEKVYRMMSEYDPQKFPEL